MTLLKLFSFTTIILILFSFSAQAQQDQKASTAEDVAIAFYKLGGITPKFTNWITEIDPYIHTPVARRPMVMEQERERLNKAYQNFRASEDFLIVLTKANLIPTAHQERIKDKEGKQEIIKHYNLEIDFGQNVDLFYIPYEFAGQNFMVVPDKIQSLTHHTLHEFDYNRIRTNTTQKKAVPLILRLKPYDADIEKPYNVDGLDQWALKAEIVSMETWDRKGSLIWEYSAPWYVSPNSKKIKKLYQERKDDNDMITEGYLQ